MKRVVKLICVLFVAIFACSLAFACNRKPDTPKPDSGSKELKGNIKIFLPIAGDEKTVIESVIASYTALHPKVKIEYRVGETSTYFEYCRTQLSSNDLSSVEFDIINAGQLSKFMNSTKFVDYSQYLAEENPYYDNKVWGDTFEPAAIDTKSSSGEIFCLNFENTQVLFAYNKTVTDELGIKKSDFETWDGFVAACAKIKEKYPDKAPLALSGNKESFYGRQMAWMLGMYTDQYFRSVADYAHSRKEGENYDWNYNPRTDESWVYNPYPELTEGMTDEQIKAAWEKAYNNDSPTIYNYNILRLLKGIKDDDLGPINKKYQNMLANIAELVPKYTLPNFTSLDSGYMISRFVNGDAFITLQQADYVYNSYLQRKENGGANFEIDFFDFPAMSANTRFPELADYGPDCDYTRSYGGSRGSYAVVNKNPEQARLCMDFMMYWTSIEGQQTALSTKEALGTPQLTTPLIKGVVVPEVLRYGVAEIPWRGSASQNPAEFFSRALKGETYSLTAFETNITNLFDSEINYNAIKKYGEKMQNDMKSNLWRYLQMQGYSADCLEDVRANPFN